jgi:cytoskeletal protein RodZ
MTAAGDSGGTTVKGPFEFRIGDELRGERATLGRSLLDVQRDLRIKAAYIAAIENAEPEVFPNPSFIPGYVRSYARYLGLDPDEVYGRFCAESGFSVAASASLTKAKPERETRARGAGTFRPDFPMAAKPAALLSQLPLPAIGSLIVLFGLAGGLGYGGWAVLQGIQRVEFAPVEEIPLALGEVETMTAPAGPSPVEAGLDELASPVAATALADLYRRQELEVPILVPRDGPIAALDPSKVGLLAAAEPPAAPASSPGGPVSLASAPGAVLAETDPTAVEPQITAAVERPGVVVVAERAAWIRVYLADNTVLFERILETGETYSPPSDVAAPMIWAGNSGSVYVRVGEEVRGPLGSGTRAVRDVVLDPAAIVERFGVVESVPDVISGAFGGPIEQAAIALQ